MANSPAYDPCSARFAYLTGVENGTVCPARTRVFHKRMFLKISFIALVLLLCLAPRASGQNSPKITTVAPAAGKVNDSVTLTGENLGKDSVSAVFLSDDKDDYKATVMEQANGKIVLKVPEVKSGGYNISIQEGDKILILPVRFTVQS
jgi:IPT/TIG domain-containing protein